MPLIPISESKNLEEAEVTQITQLIEEDEELDCPSKQMVNIQAI